MTAARVAFLRSYATAQMAMYEASGIGWFFWNFKMERKVTLGSAT